jgi:hypothetical protein
VKRRNVSFAALAVVGLMLLSNVPPTGAGPSSVEYSGCLYFKGKKKGKLVKVKEGPVPLSACNPDNQNEVHWNQQGQPGQAGNLALAGTACDDGQFVTGFDETGSPTCSTLPVAQPGCFFGAFGNEVCLDPNAVYVSAEDPAAVDDPTCGLGPTGTGAGNHPCATIVAGLNRAAALNRVRVFVAQGTYGQSVTLTNGRSLLGGYSTHFGLDIPVERDPDAFTTIIAPPAVGNQHNIAVTASGITQPTKLEGFEIVAPSPSSGTARNSIGVHVVSSDADLEITNNVIRGGTASTGGDGTDGSAGASGAGGGKRADNPAQYDATDYKSLTMADLFDLPNGGDHVVSGSDDIGGGDGGGKGFPVDSVSGHRQASGSDGQPGSGTLGGLAGTGGLGGFDGELASQSGTCALFVLAQPLEGTDGTAGSSGGNGPGGSGGTGSVSVVSGHLVGSAANGGVSGGNGGGGGGGGAAGGEFDVNCPSNGSNGAAALDRAGGHGGGGGAGGQGGGGGGGATSGGASIGIYIIGGSPPTITSNEIQRGIGGDGGFGGRGANGGLGGAGGQGGADSIAFQAFFGGDGGDGGDGGHGGGGGGGAGGPSIGIVGSGIGSPSYASTNTFTSGRGGRGGRGGPSVVNVGADGAAGTLAAALFL